jgi:hypothetical protein
VRRRRGERMAGRFPESDEEEEEEEDGEVGPLDGPLRERSLSPGRGGKGVATAAGEVDDDNRNMGTNVNEDEGAESGVD